VKWSDDLKCRNDGKKGNEADVKTITKDFAFDL
jgi:hypothetical protein